MNNVDKITLICLNLEKIIIMNEYNAYLILINGCHASKFLEEM